MSTTKQDNKTGRNEHVRKKYPRAKTIKDGPGNGFLVKREQYKRKEQKKKKKMKARLPKKKFSKRKNKPNN